MLTKFKIDELGCKSLNPESASDSFRRGSSNIVTLFKELSPDCGCARMTFFDKCFNGSLHTFGLVRNKDTIYVLDSLGHNAETSLCIKDFHAFIEILLSANMREYGLKKGY